MDGFMIKGAIADLVAGKDLEGAVVAAVVRDMMSGSVEAAAVAAFLTALAIKGETVEEVVAAASVMRDLACHVDLPDTEVVVDPVGTGGDGASLFNVSTASAVVASAAGIKVAKHGNIAASSASGSADVLREAGVRLELAPDEVLQSLERCGFGFMYAPAFHAAMRHVVPVRKAIGIRTVFNVLGPLCNPARVKYQVLGVFAKRWVRPMVEVAKNLGAKRIIAVHAENGLDEFSVTARNFVCELKENGEIIEYVIDPKDFGMNYDDHSTLQVRDATQSLALIKSAFSYQAPSIAVDMLAVNSAAIFLVAGVVNAWEEGIDLAKSVMGDGRATTQLRKIATVSQKIGER